jgi:hypothetical protein
LSIFRYQVPVSFQSGAVQEAGRIWPVWVWSLGAMWEAGAIVPLRPAQGCPRCERVYDVDLEALNSFRRRNLRQAQDRPGA